MVWEAQISPFLQNGSQSSTPLSRKLIYHIYADNSEVCISCPNFTFEGQGPPHPPPTPT